MDAHNQKKEKAKKGKVPLYCLSPCNRNHNHHQEINWSISSPKVMLSSRKEMQKRHRPTIVYPTFSP
jgi:hypothetical protein